MKKEEKELSTLETCKVRSHRNLAKETPKGSLRDRCDAADQKGTTKHSKLISAAWERSEEYFLDFSFKSSSAFPQSSFRTIATKEQEGNLCFMRNSSMDGGKKWLPQDYFLFLTLNVLLNGSTNFVWTNILSSIRALKRFPSVVKKEIRFYRKEVIKFANSERSSFRKKVSISDGQPTPNLKCSCRREIPRCLFTEEKTHDCTLVLFNLCIHSEKNLILKNLGGPKIY